MAVINLPAPVVTADLDLMRVQQRFEGAVTTLINTPFGNGVLVTGITLQSTSSPQQVSVRHGLGRAVTGALIWNCNVQVYGPWHVQTVDNNNCTLYVVLPAGVTSGTGSLSLWVG